jgi:hypothetical protein
MEDWDECYDGHRMSIMQKIDNVFPAAPAAYQIRPIDLRSETAASCGTGMRARRLEDRIRGLVLGCPS